MNTPNFKGVGVALVTPFDEQNRINLEEYAQVIRYVIKGGVDFILALGSTGEYPTLTWEERQAIIHKAVETAQGQVPVLIGIGGNNTESVVHDLRTFDLTGVDAILSVAPSYNKPTQKGLYEHFKQIALNSPLPIILYNVPGRTGCNISAKTTLRLAADFKQIIGIKEAGSDWTQMIELAANKPKDFFLLSGSDDIIVPQVSLGFDGVISVVANATPKHFTDMVHQALEGKFEIARQGVFELNPFISMMFEQGNPCGVKSALASLKVCSDRMRLPLVDIDEELKDRIQTKLKSLDLIS